MICLYDDCFDLAFPVSNGAGYMGYAHCPGDSARRAEFDRCGFIYTLHHDSRCRGGESPALIMKTKIVSYRLLLISLERAS
jgi:hypothetical protein